MTERERRTEGKRKRAKWRKCIWGSGNKRGREGGLRVALRKGGLDGEREGAQEPEMEAGEGVGVLIALKRSGLFVCLLLL